MGDISKHFSRYEFACKCGCGKDTVDVELVKLCEVSREFVGASITPSSGCRCPRHNKEVGGGDKSQHLLCKAGDLPVDNPRDLYNFLCSKYPNKYGFGLYNTFVHADCRSKKARWDNT